MEGQKSKKIQKSELPRYGLEPQSRGRHLALRRPKEVGVQGWTVPSPFFLRDDLVFYPIELSELFHCKSKT